MNYRASKFCVLAPQGQQLNPNLFTGQINLAQPFAAGQPIGLAPGINALVNQAAFSNVNNAALAAAQRQLVRMILKSCH